MRLAWDCQRRILAGDLPSPDEYEAVPYLEQMEQRLAAGREHLLAVVERRRRQEVG